MLRYKKTGQFFVITSAAVIIFYSCKKNEHIDAGDPLAALNLPATPYNYASQPLPVYLQPPLSPGRTMCR